MLYRGEAVAVAWAGGAWAAIRTAAVAVVAWLVAVGALVVPVVVLVGHFRDAYQLNHSSGVWLALGAWADHGVVMPPLHEGQYFGGTRYMPLPIALFGALTRIIGSPVPAARTFAVIGTVCLCAAVYRYARALGASVVLTLLGIGLMLSVPATMQALVGIRNDALSVALGLFAMLCVQRGGSRRRWLVAGALCALAVSVKISEVWPAVALFVFALLGERGERVERAGQRRIRGRALPLVLGFVVAAAVLLVASIAVTQGRFLPELAATLLGGEDSLFALRDWIPRLVEVGLVDGIGVLLPILVLGWLSALAGLRRATPLSVATLVAGAVTVLVYVDRGADINHLTALVALGLVAGLEVVQQWTQQRPERALLHLSAAALVAISSFTAWDNGLWSALHDEHPAFYVAPASPLPVLSEDPTVPVLAGELPVVSDPFAFRRLALTHPEWAAELDARIASGGFSEVVLLAGPTQTDPTWYERIHFGRDTIATICHSYHSVGLVDDGRYEILAPGAGEIPSGSVCARAAY